MWGQAGSPATPMRFGARASRLRALPRLQGAHFPSTLVNAAGLALEPGFLAAADVARQKIATHEAVLGVRGSERRQRPARAGSGCFPRHADVFAFAR